MTQPRTPLRQLVLGAETVSDIATQILERVRSPKTDGVDRAMFSWKLMHYVKKYGNRNEQSHVQR